jgi:hypothetical protein
MFKATVGKTNVPNEIKQKNIFLEVLMAVTLDGFCNVGHEWPVHWQKYTGFRRNLLPLSGWKVQGASVNRAILKTSRTVNAFIYLVSTHMNTIYI